jgi:hypothetical protein
LSATGVALIYPERLFLEKATTFFLIGANTGLFNKAKGYFPLAE